MRNRNAAFKLPSKTTPIYAEEICDMRTLLNDAKSEMCGSKQAGRVCVSATAWPVAEYRSRLVDLSRSRRDRDDDDDDDASVNDRPSPATRDPWTRDQGLRTRQWAPETRATIGSRNCRDLIQLVATRGKGAGAGPRK